MLQYPGFLVNFSTLVNRNIILIFTLLFNLMFFVVFILFGKAGKLGTDQTVDLTQSTFCHKLKILFNIRSVCQIWLQICIFLLLI